MERSLVIALGALVSLSAAYAAPVRPPITSVSHLAVYAADPAASEEFYVHKLGAVKRDDPENPKGARYYFNPIQFVEVLPLPAGWTSVSRFDHAAFNTADAKALRKYIAANYKAVKPGKLMKGSDRSVWFDIADPEGNTIQFVQQPANPQPVPVNPLSSHIIHFGFIIRDRAKEDSFFRTVLGFRPYWFGGMKDDVPQWISQQVPDGNDWLEYMVVSDPTTVSQATSGVLDHFSLGVANIEETVTLLYKEGRMPDKFDGPKIGRDSKWQFNSYDPDGTRAEIMEFQPVAKPCCSPFTADSPTK
jgi:catechol 2,3-dioxygenase-like lactoylglutathione lyase family enzyme